MEIKKNSRQVPKKEEYTASKMYSDIVYSWLQVNSEFDEETKIRWIDKKKINFSSLASELNLARQTVSIKFKRLLNKDEKGNEGLGLIAYNDELKRYELLNLPENMAMLVEQNTLRKMVSTFNENAISTYVYLLKRYLANQEQSYEFTLNQIKEFIGLGVNTRSNNYIVTDILSILKRLGLVDFQLVNMEGQSMKTIYKILFVRNELPEI